MSFLNDKAKFAVKTSNLSTVAKFSSTLDDAYFLILANNSNNYLYGCNNHAAVFGASSASNFEAYIGLVNNNLVHKLAQFNNYDIRLNRNLVVTGNLVPTSNITYDLGTPEYKWRDLYLSGNSIYVGETILSSDPETGSLSIKNSSNEIAPMVASKLKLVSSGTSSNYSVFTSTDYGINLTFYDKDDNEINHLDLGQGDTSMLPEGSNLYYTFERFDERLLTKTLDDIIIGTSNRYITNDTYNRDLYITGTLFASNLVVYGDRTTLNTETFQTEQLDISSDANAPVLQVRQLGTGNVLQIQSGSNIAMLINNEGLMGINTSNPAYELDVLGTAQATYFKGDASQMYNVNLADRTTSLLSEGSNLYYTSERVGIIATSSNIDTSNYICNTSNEISNRLTDTSNLISDRLTDTSNLISNRLTDTSNLISNRLTDTSNLISDRLTDTSNLISNRLTDTSNLISNRITDLTTSEVAEGSNLYYTFERFDERLLTKTLDNIYVGTSNKYIVNDVYNSDLRVTGTFSASNLVVNGSFTTLDTITYQTKKLEIVSDSDAPALLIRQDGNSNIIEVYDDNNIVFSILNDGRVGINKLNPSYALDVSGTVNADYYIGDGRGLYNVYLGDRDTSMLAEGSNLYYTSERVGIISTASNIDTSNYIAYSSNTLINELALTSNMLAIALASSSSDISTRISNLTTQDIAENPNNLFYTVERFDERLLTKTADFIADGSSNRYIVSDIYNSDLTITGTLTASNLVVVGDISMLNTNTYQTERMEIISDVAGPALKITQQGSSDLLHIYDDAQIAMSVIKGGNVGIKTIAPEYPLDVVGTLRASYLIGDASGLSNVNLSDRTTSLLAEGSNLYYTPERVGAIATASNIDTSNYIYETSNYLIATILQTSNVLTDTINNVVNVEIDNTLAYVILTSNFLINNIIDTSNILTYEINETINTEINTTIANLEYTSNVLLDLITSTSNELTDTMNNVVNVQVGNSATNLTNTSNELITNIITTSNNLTNTINNVVNIQVTNASNFIVATSNILTDTLKNYNSVITSRLDNLSTSEIPEGTGTANLYYTDARFDIMLQSKSLDHIRDGTSNRYITNDIYNGDLYITGTLSTSNLIVNGYTTVLNTTTYQSKKLEIVSDAIGPALKVQQNGIFDIMQVYDDSNIVMSIVNGGRVGINTSNPLYTMDVAGTTRANMFIGDGSGLSRVNFLDRNTSMLVEGSNLYYTSERVGTIATSCNINTSNYIETSSNAISNRITNTSNQLDAYITSTSNTLYTNLIASSNFITLNLATTSNLLMRALIDTSNLAINTSNEIMTNLIATYNTTTSNFFANSNALALNIQNTSNNLATLITNTSLNITSSVSDTSNTLITNTTTTSNALIANTNATFNTLSSNLTNVSNYFVNNIPVVYGNFLNNLNNVSNLIATQIVSNSNVLTATILNHSNTFTSRILDTSNVISTRITSVASVLNAFIVATSNDYASNLTMTSNTFNTLFQLNSNQIYTYFNQTSNTLSTDVVYNSNVISKRISDLTLDMIAVGTSNTYIVNNIYDANLTITGSLVVNSLDVIDLGLLEMNETGQYINTDMKTYVARITSNVLAYAPAIIANASNNFDIYDARQSNYVATKQNILSGAVSTITEANLTGNRIVVTNNAGKLVASTASASNLEQIASLNAPVQTQINNMNINSSNLALNILDRIAFLNQNIGQSTGGTGNNLSVANVVRTCNIISFDPVVYLKFEDTADSSKYASKNYQMARQYPSYTGHTNDLIVWYKFDNNANNWIDNTDKDLYLVYGVESYVLDRVYGLNSVILNGSTSYTMGQYTNAVIPRGITFGQNREKGLSLSFWMNTNRVFTGRQYVFSFCSSNLFFVPNSASIEAYVNTSNLCVSVGQGSNTVVYNVPCPIMSNIDYNVVWQISSNNLWEVNMNGITYTTSGMYPPNSNYLYNTVGGQAGIFSSNFFNGYVSDLRVYNKDLVSSEIDDNTNIKYPSYDLHRNDLLLWYNFDGHLQNFDGNLNYALSLGAGTLSYVSIRNLTLYSLLLNGSTYYVMNTASAINFNTVSDIYPTGLTFSITFSPNVVNTTQYLFCMSDTASSTPTRSIEVFLINSQLNFRVRQNGTTTMQTASINTSIVAQKFYNIIWVMSKGVSDTTASWYIYLNGTSIFTSEGDRYYAITGTYSYNYVGSIFNGSLFNGYIDDLRVYKKRLSYDEVSKIYVYATKYGSFTNHTANLVSWFNFENNNVSSVMDNTIPLVYLNFKDKKMITYNNTNNYILYNNSNILNIYPAIDNFTEYTSVPNYNANNSYALISNRNTYVYYTNQTDLINLLTYVNGKGFVLHFAIKCNNVLNVPLYYLGNQTKGYINVILYYGCIYVIIGEGTNAMHIYNERNINNNSWAIVDIVARIQYGRIGFEMYINGILQNIFVNVQNTLYTNNNYNISNLLFEYKPATFSYTFESTALYTGAYNPRYNSNNYNIAGYDVGAVVNLTYFSANIKYYDYAGGIKTAVNSNSISLLNTSPVSSDTFNAYLNQVNNNKYWVAQHSIYLSSNDVVNVNNVIDNNKYISSNSIPINDVKSTLVEVIGNFYAEDGFYHFAVDLQNEIACELVISGTNLFANNIDSIVVASYYNGNLNTPSNNITNANVLQYPIKLNTGYYKLWLKILRKPVDIKYIIGRYYKYNSYTGAWYSILSKNIGYISYDSLSADVKNGMLDVSGLLYINTNNIIENVVSTNPILIGEDYGVYTIGYSATSNAMGAGSLGYTSNMLVNVLGSNDVVKMFSNIANVSVGNNHTLILLNDGTVYSCGANNAGQLGIGLAIDNSVNKYLKQVKGVDGVGYISNIIQVSAGDNHSLFLKNDGTLYACGLNVFGQLGIGNVNTTNVLKQINIADVSSVSAGNNTSLVVKSDGSAWGCGRNDSGQLAQGIINTCNVSLISILDVGYSNQLNNVKQVQAGGSWSLFLKNDGTCYASGGSSNIRSLYRVVGSNVGEYMNNISQISARADFGCLFLTSNAIVYRSTSNVLNVYGTISKVNTKTVVNSVEQANNNIYFLDNTGKAFKTGAGAVYACGSQGPGGNLGTGGSGNHHALVQVLGLGGVGYISNITQLFAGMNDTLFLHTSGTVYACGYNQFGSIGIGNGGYGSSYLLQVLSFGGSGAIAGIIQASVGGSHSLFLHSSGAVYACGRNESGQLGINSTTNQTYIVQVAGVGGSGSISGITQVYASGSSSFLLHGSGAVYACGYNMYRQLGTINGNNRVLEQVLGVGGSGYISGITQIVAGANHSLFLHNSGIVYACGYNGNGQLGINNTSDQVNLVQVLGVGGSGYISGITKIASKGYHSMFLHSSGIVYACGANGNGQLGINNTISQTALVQVLGIGGSGFISGITQIEAGAYHSLFLHNSGIVYACGDNNSGQLGINNNTITQQNALVQVLDVGGSGYISEIAQISAGWYHSVFTKFFDYNSLIPVADEVNSKVNNIKKISAYNHLMIVDSSNFAYSTGKNTYGQLVNNTNIDKTSFQYVLDGEGRYNVTNILKIVPYCVSNNSNFSGANYSLLLSSNGLVYFTGQGGAHSANIATTPYLTYISALSAYKIIDMACGGADDTSGSSNYNIFLTNTGNVYSIPLYNFIKDGSGSNLSNIIEIGCRKNNLLMYFINKDSYIFQSTAYVSGSMFNVNPATNVVGLGGQGVMKNIRQVDGGLSYTIFLSNSGEVYGLGDNTYGQLGTGNNTNATVPTYMKGLDGTTNIKNIVKVSCGNYYTLLLNRDTRVFATGYNIGGILGVGTTANTNVLKEVLNINGVGALTDIKDISCGVANVVPMIAAVLLLGANNNIYVNGASTSTTGLLTLLNDTQTINRTINSVHAAGAWLFLNTIKYDNMLVYDGIGKQYAFKFDESNSTNFYVYGSNMTLNIQDVRMYTADGMGTSNIIVNQLDKGIYTPSTNPAPNNVIYTSNTTFDTNTYYSGVASLKFSSSNNSFAYLEPNFYNFGVNDTTISMWIDADNNSLKYPASVFTSNSVGSLCVSSAFSNLDVWRCFDNSTSTNMNLMGFTQLYGIGYNNVGQLGDNSTTNRTSGYVPVINNAGLDSIVVSIEGSANETGWFVHLLTDTGRVYAILSTGLSLIDPNYFAGERITMIASGRSTYFITESGLLYAYGLNTYGQLGNGNTTTQNTPILIPSSRWNGEKVVYVATGRYHTYIITSSGAVFTIGYNNNGQLGSGNTTNQSNWTLFTALPNVVRAYCSGDQTYLITSAGLLYSVGVRTNLPFLESSIPSTKRIVKMSFSAGNCAFALADDGTVYGYGNNPISMPNTSAAQTNFLQMTSTVWGNLRIVDVATGGDHTFYTLENGQVYVVGNNNYGQLNIPTSTGSSKTPLLVSVGGARINKVYGGLFTTGYNIISVYPSEMFVEFGASRGEYVKFDVIDAIGINYANIVLNTPASTTSLTYAVSLKLYGTNAGNALNNFNVLWDLIGTYESVLPYSASPQTATIVSSANVPYRYYALVINSRYNINIADIALYVNGSIANKKTIFDACIDETNYLNISLQSSNITASVCVAGTVSSITVSHPAVYSTGVLYGLSVKYNTDPTDATWTAYTNGVLAKTVQPMPYPASGSYGNIMLGRSVYSMNGNNYYYSGYIDDLRIYNRALSMQEMSSIYTAMKFNVEGYTAGNYVNKYALVSSRDMYVYNTNYNDISGLLRNIDANGFTIHFVFRTSNVVNQPLYNLGGKLIIRVVAGVLCITLGSSFVIVSKTVISKNTWYIVDLIGSNTGNGKIVLQLYINNILQRILVNNAYNTSHTLNYSGALAPDNTPLMSIYVGNYQNVYRDDSEIVRGCIFTNTYYSSNVAVPVLLTRCPLNSADFASMVSSSDSYYSYQLSSNMRVDLNDYYAYTGSNYVYGNYVGRNRNTINFILNQVDGNVWLSAGYYYFACDVAGDVACELYIGADSLKNVANYYATSLTNSDNILDDKNKTSILPIYIPEGYYRFQSKTFSRVERKYVHHKYVKVAGAAGAAGYTGDYYTLFDNIDYQAYNTIDAGLRSGAVGVASSMWIVKNSADYASLRISGASIDSSIYGIGDNRVHIFDNGLVNRASGTDSVSTTYVNRINTGHSIGASLLNWSFYSTQSGRSITPLILENTSGTNFAVRAIGTSRTVVGSGVYSFNFGLASGSNIFANSNYCFGWKDGTPTSANQGVITNDSTNAVAQSTYALTGNSSTNIVLGTSYDFGNTILGNRTYSFRLEFSTLIESSNYLYVPIVNETSNYVVDGAEYTSNYLVNNIIDYSVPYVVYNSSTLNALKGVIQVANGSAHTVILRVDGSVLSCGDNRYGQLGLNSTVSTNVFSSVLDVSSGVLGSVKSIGCGSFWSHFVKTDGTAYGCGMNLGGNIGDNSTTQRNRVVQVLGVGGVGVLSSVQSVVGGFSTNMVSLFLRTDGTVVGCGNNLFGTLGDNTTTQRNVPVQVLGVGGTGVLSRVKQVCANSTTSVFLLTDGTVFACGGNSFGQIGDLSTVQRNTVVQVRGIGGQGVMTKVVQIAANGGSMHTLFLREDGVVYSCGFNGTGQLGNSNLTSFPYPMRVMNPENTGAISGIVQIANTADNSYFLRYDGSLLSCGSDTLGQLGNGVITSNYMIPVYSVDKSGYIIRGFSQLSVGGWSEMNTLFNNGAMQYTMPRMFYIANVETEKPEVYIQDFRIYNNGNVITSNLINLNTSDSTLLFTSYSTYNEITDANRWMKSKDYYLYSNGVLNRSIYYTEGNVGIGTSAPNASLEIYTVDGSMNSIKTNNPIWAQTGVLTSSDRRIKKNIVDIDDISALEQILKIEPKIYNYVDEKRDKQDVYGFIAQQVSDVIPNAVSVQSESVPNIYKNGSVVNGNVIVVEGYDLRSQVSVGMLVDVVVKSGMKVRCEVMEVINSHMMRVDTFFDDAEVLVYGTVVDDFHTLDKNYIYTLNVCATQDLYRQYKANEKKLEDQNKRIEMLIEKIDKVNKEN